MCAKLEGVCDRILDLTSLDTQLIRYLPKDYIDMDIVKSFSNYEKIYQYLNSIGSVRVNLPLEHMYLLLYYDEIETFKNND